MKNFKFSLAHVIACAIFSFTYLPSHAQRLALSTRSDSALFYYEKGWQQVMDEGNYTASELAYRKMMSFDENFLMGLSLVGRITRDLSERTRIEKTLEGKKSAITGDERLLLDNYINLVKYTNLRETQPDAAKAELQKIFKAGEKNLRVLVHRYKDEIYYKAEYIEVLHLLYGAKPALDSLARIASKAQQQQPFLLGYAAQLEAELGHFDDALKLGHQLNKIVSNDRSPKPHAVFADIYVRQGDLQKAKKHIDAALALDPGNIDVQRLKKKIENEEK